MTGMIHWRQLAFIFFDTTPFCGLFYNNTSTLMCRLYLCLEYCEVAYGWALAIFCRIYGGYREIWRENFESPQWTFCSFDLHTILFSTYITSILSLRNATADFLWLNTIRYEAHEIYFIYSTSGTLIHQFFVPRKIHRSGGIKLRF